MAVALTAGAQTLRAALHACPAAERALGHAGYLHAPERKRVLACGASADAPPARPARGLVAEPRCQDQVLALGAASDVRLACAHVVTSHTAARR